MVGLEAHKVSLCTSLLTTSTVLADDHQVDQGHLASTLQSYDGYASAKCSCFQPSEMTLEHVHNRFSEPALVEASPLAVHQLGMVLPAVESLSIPELVKTLGYEKEVSQDVP